MQKQANLLNQQKSYAKLRMIVMKNNLHQKFLDDIRIPTEEIQNTKNSDLGLDEKELMRKLEQKFDELFGPIDDDD